MELSRNTAQIELGIFGAKNFGVNSFCPKSQLALASEVSLLGPLLQLMQLMAGHVLPQAQTPFSKALIDNVA